MRCQNVCCQKALGQVDKHGRNRRRGLYVKVSFYVHETRLCCYKTARVPTVAETFGQHPRIIWATIWATPSRNLGNNVGNTLGQKWATILATHPFVFGNTPSLYLGNTCQPSCWLLFQWFLVAIIPMLSRWLLFRCFPGGSKKQDSTTKPHVFLLNVFVQKYIWATPFWGSRG